ncbi:MAG: hypothetical protein II978_04825 [Clostridia bacterium]|nr:hypothetical protein [Clostridia bacterium]
MGIFGGNYSKPGKGITKEEASKRNYFDILSRKFWKLVQLNLLYAVCNILFIGASIFLAIGYDWVAILSALLKGQLTLLPPLPFIPLMLMGPFTAGLTYVIRNYSRQEHAFMASDFFEHSKKNIKQGLLMSVLQVVATYLLITAFFFYLNFFIAHGLNTGILFGIAIVVTVLMLSMSFYVYPIMVTFDMKLIHILKNSWIFAISKLPQNLFILIILAAVHGLLIWYYPLVWLILMPLFLIVWSSYTMNYYVWNVMDKYMMSQIEKPEEESESVFDDSLLDK